MGGLEHLAHNLVTPMVLAFLLGLAARLARSDLEIPRPLYEGMAIYLLLVIGFKGGVELGRTTFQEIWRPALASLALGMAIPLWCYAILRKLGRFGVPDAAALAAHYGSVSVVTFITGVTFLQKEGIPFEGFLPALVAILEVPAILVAILLARRKGEAATGSWKRVLGETLGGKSIVLLAGGLVIGLLSGERGLREVEPVFAGAFKGVLTFFLLEMGLLAAARLGEIRRTGVFLVAFGIIMPVLHGIAGAWLGRMAGLSVGGATILGTLAASASYIAAPAAVRVALPTANPSFYLTASLGVTFPFNLTIGIPLYHAAARLFV